PPPSSSGLSGRPSGATSVAPQDSPAPPTRRCWVARMKPRLSGLTQCPLEAELGLALWRALLGVEQAIDALAMHEVGAHQSGEGERAFCDPGGVSGEFEQQIGDHGHGDLDADGVFRAADKVPDLEGLLDPSEEQL